MKAVVRLPINEQKRLEDLQSFSVLDSETDQVFDELVRLAADLCEAPIALISLVDEDRQWFKAKHGMTESETARGVSFCTHAIRQDELFIVPDATADERFKDSPLVTEGPRVRFYAGMPLKSARGYNLGTLCVIDQRPRDFTLEQGRILKVLGRQVVYQLERLRLVNIHAHTLQAEQVLRSNLNSILNFLPEGVVTENKDNKIDFVNQSFCHLMNLAEPPVALVGEDMRTLVQGISERVLNPEEFKLRVQKNLDNRKPVLGEKISLVDGRVFVRDYIPLAHNGECTGHAWIFREVSLQLETQSMVDRLKQALAEKAKLAALGQMAADMAHEINNPLAAISTRSVYLKSLAERSALTTEAATDGLHKINTIVERISRIVKGLRNYSREGSADDLHSFKVKDLIDETLAFCQEPLRVQGVDLRIECDPGLDLLGKRTLLSQVLLNLINNAAEACSTAPIGERWISVSARKLPSKIEIRVANSGTIIPVQIRKKIFDAFFTTKSANKGTGLGLSISKKIMGDQGGSLSLNEEAPHTEFVMALPQ